MNSQRQPTSQALIWLMAGLSLAALPHFSYQPLWVSIIFIAMIAWRCMAIWYDWPLPGKPYRHLSFIQLTIAGIAAILLFYSYGNLIGRDAGTALLTVMLGLKVIEIRTQRDYYLSCFLGYFLVITNFLYSQSILTAALMFIVVTVMTVCLISINDTNHSLSRQKQLRLATKILVQAIPLMLVLFILFPRISGPLWGLPQDAHTAKTGMDNKMTLGKISQLIQSDEVAFRVKFDQIVPEAADLYWRGPVLSNSDGTTWTETKRSSLKQPILSTKGQVVDYAVILEPHNEHWLFALDMPDSLPTELKSKQFYSGQLLATKPIKQRIQYQLRSYTDFSFNPELDASIEQSLQLPKNKHPRTRQLAEQWLTETSDPEQLINRTLNHFNQQSFYYTLTPPLLTGDTIDSFLFESRRGFCEHYAASFTILMRAMGIPTRIVTGYQGGEFNPVDGYHIIRQQDAHAWTEVWLSGKGWIRIDPTAAVARDRIELGMDNIMPANMRAPLLFAASNQLVDIWQDLRNNWDALNNAWNRSILAYGPELQKEFLATLGMDKPDWQTMVIYLVVLFNLVLAVLVLILFNSRKKIDPVIKTYQQFCKKLKRLDLDRLPSEGPTDFSNRVIKQYPHLENEVSLITRCYIDLRYSQKQIPIKTFTEAVKQFTPSKTA